MKTSGLEEASGHLADRSWETGISPAIIADEMPTSQYQSGLGEWFGDLAPMQSHQFSS
jgi:hypothetical protein